MVFVQAAISERGPAARLVGMAESHAIELFVSSAILDEVAEVLERPRFRIRSPRLTFERIDGFLDRLRHISTLIREVPKVVRLSRDPDDEVYLDLAIAANAEYIVTRDHDLLDLMNPAKSGGVMLPASVHVVTPKQFLLTLESLDRGDPA
jgi:putative PIN family toxin of toxin-antitoxin system